MSEFWDEYVGQTLAGSYVLGERLGSGERTAVYATDSGNYGPTVTKIALADQEDSSAFLLHWAIASQLSHPNLISLFKTGQAELGGIPVAFVVMERAEETLASVLADRPLSESEVRELLPPMLSALGYLHGHGFCHGAIRPSNVMALGETLKLSSDGVVRNGEQVANAVATPYDAPEGSFGTPTPEADVWSLGVLLHYALTLRYPELQDGKTVSTAALPEPFATLIAHCLVAEPNARWSVTQLQRGLEDHTNVPKRVEAAAVSSFHVPVAPEPPSLPNATSPEVAPYRRTLAARLSQPAASEAEPVRTYPPWLIPALGVAAVILLIFIVVKLRSGSAPSHPAPQNATAVPASQPPSPQPATEPLPAAVAPPSPAQRPAAEPIAPTKHRNGGGGWYVVAATYSAKDAADKRAREITKKWPHFRAHVYEPPVRDPHHLVVIGADLSQDDAEALRKRARAAGLPRDVYIKRFGR